MSSPATGHSERTTAVCFVNSPSDYVLLLSFLTLHHQLTRTVDVSFDIYWQVSPLFSISEEGKFVVKSMPAFPGK